MGFFRTGCSNFDGLFIYKHDGKFILLDTTRGVRVGEYDTESHANRDWARYIDSGRDSEKTTPYAEKDKETLNKKG